MQKGAKSIFQIEKENAYILQRKSKKANRKSGLRVGGLQQTPNIWFDNLFLNATLVRVHQMNKGFIELINNGNYLCTAPLGIRKQNQ